MTRIIACVMVQNRAQARRAAERAAMAGADWVELRLDRVDPGEDLASLIRPIRLPVLATCRTPKDGGGFRGTLAERRTLLQKALDAGAQGLDLEHWETWQPSVGQNRLRLLIRSFHSLSGIPKDLPAIQSKLFSMRANVGKIAVTAHDLAEAGPVLDLLSATDQRAQPTVAFAMGTSASATRVLSCLLGSPFVYAAESPESETAPGQIDVRTAAGLYRVREIGGSTAVFGLLGNPALTSLGPWLHNRAFRRLGLDAVYLPFETSRPEQVLAVLPRRRLRGLSVTAPFKQVMASQCHRLSPEAAATGVVNTLTVEAHGLIVGHNTDVAGVQGALARAGLERGDGRPGVVLGTGGAARAAALALEQLGLQVTMLGRSLDPSREFAAARGIRLGSLQASVLRELDPLAVVHATPVGSIGRDPAERLLEDWTPKPGTFVLDMVYRPYRTALLADAEKAGAIAVPGMEMFLTQARHQIALFTGGDLPEQELAAFLAGSSGAA